MTEATYVPGPWSLEDLVPASSGPQMESVFAEVEAAASAIEAMRHTLVPEIAEADFTLILGLIERLARADLRLDTYAAMRFFADMQDQDALAFMDRVEGVLADAANRTVFFQLWWKALDNENAQRLQSAAGDIGYHLQTLRNFAPYSLSEETERVIGLKNSNGSGALMTLYRTITNGFKFDVEDDELDEPESLTRGGIIGLARGTSPSLREAAYRSMLDVYGSHRNALGRVFRHIAADWRSENVDLRGVPSPISVRNLENDIPDAAVDALLEACRENVGVFHRFFKLKAKWLGAKQLSRFDLYAPLDETADEIPFDDGVRLVLDAFGRFSPRMADLARRVLDDGYLDSECRPGKRSGALSADALPGTTPWVMMSYGGCAADVSTLAHELGHAVHALLAEEHSALTFSPPLPLAETASTFGQALLLESAAERSSDPQFRRALLARSMDESYTAISRQAFMVLFERKAHQMVADGASTDDLCDAYLGNLRLQFGDAVDVDDVFQYEWLSHPHLFTHPFYDYAYAFGHLLVLSLFQRYRDEGESFIPDYLKILAYGGSKAPADILADVGIDICAKPFWQGGFDVLSSMVDELEALS